MREAARSKIKDIGRTSRPGNELERILRDALDLVAGTKAAPTRQPHEHGPHGARRHHRLVRTAGHLAGYTVLGYIIVHQRRGLRNIAA
ncbi:hypothetical protein [Streptomyces sp. NPDC048277]|uniref:hypothetical protein n=1 Tax=Streptomyces sp. NPDC048277 TaxID=3155027 RepID=UPI0033E4A071